MLVQELRGEPQGSPGSQPQAVGVMVDRLTQEDGGAKQPRPPWEEAMECPAPGHTTSWAWGQRVGQALAVLLAPGSLMYG